MSKASKEDADAADFREGLAKLSSFLKVALQELESARRMADTIAHFLIQRRVGETFGR